MLRLEEVREGEVEEEEMQVAGEVDDCVDQTEAAERRRKGGRRFLKKKVMETTKFLRLSTVSRLAKLVNKGLLILFIKPSLFALLVCLFVCLFHCLS